MRLFNLVLITILAAIPLRSVCAADFPSIFIRYQYNADDVLGMLKQAEGSPLKPDSTAARWLDEMGWRNWVREYAARSFWLTPEIVTQLKAQENFLQDSFRYQAGDLVWVPAEPGEEPYGKIGVGDRGATATLKVNHRAQIKQIISSGKNTYFVVEVGVDNGYTGGTEMVNGSTFSDGTKPLISYAPSYRITPKTYVYGLDEIQALNRPFRSLDVGSAQGRSVDYVTDQKWLDRLNRFKDLVVSKKLEIDFTAPGATILEKQKLLFLDLFRTFTMPKPSAAVPEYSGTLGRFAEGGTNCFGVACVMAHGVQAVGEPYGITAQNVDGKSLGPFGGHGFLRIAMRGPVRSMTFEATQRSRADGKALAFPGWTLSTSSMHYVADGGWAQQHEYRISSVGFLPVERALEPHSITASRAVDGTIYYGVTCEALLTKFGNRNILGINGDFGNVLFRGRAQEFLRPAGQIPAAPALAAALGSAEVSRLMAEARSLAVDASGLAVSRRTLKSRIFENIASQISAVPTSLAINLPEYQIEVTEYLFRGVL